MSEHAVVAGADIEISIAQQDAASRTLAVTVPVEKVRAAEADAVRYYGRAAKLPGFRKGKVPESVVRRRFGEAIRQAALEELLREAWEKAREEQGLKPIGDPRVKVTKFQEGEPLTFELSVDVRPAIDLSRLGGFRLARQVAAVSDEMVDAQLLALREQRAPWVPAQGRPKPGDLVEALIRNLDEAEESGEPVHFVLGQGRALPELEARVMELEAGGIWEGTVRFPDDHPEEAKRGQTRRLHVSLREVKRQEVPALTDEFAREVGDFADVAALRAAVRRDLEADAAREADARLRGELIDQIAAANNVAVPPSLLERALHAYAHAYGVPEDQHARFTGEFRPVAEAQVRRDLIIEAVADGARLHATAAQLDARVAEMAARRGESPAALRAALDKAGRLRELERALTDDNVFTHLLGQSTVEDAPLAR
jgi:trigger factor